MTTREGTNEAAVTAAIHLLHRRGEEQMREGEVVLLSPNFATRAIAETALEAMSPYIRQAVAAQFRDALLDGLDQLERDQHRRISPGAVEDLIHAVAAEVGR